MNKVAGKKDDGTPFLVLLLEPGNVFRLKRGEPITLRVGDMFPNGVVPESLELWIHYSTTPVSDFARFSEHAKMATDERTPVSESKRPHCPECKSTVEQLGIWNTDGPVNLAFCAVCGCVLGTHATGKIGVK
jgi:hypothetical protein